MVNINTTENIYDVCLCRKNVLDVLLRYISPHECSQSVNSLFLYGNTGTGKTYLLKTILETLEVPHSFVNCIESYTSKHVYHKVLKDAGYYLTKQCTSMVEFCRLLKQCDLDSSFHTFYIILDKVERLRTMESHLLPAFLRLGEICQLNICVLFVTELVLEKFFITTGFHQPIPIHFPDYTKEEVIAIMALDFAGFKYSKEFYEYYCKIVVDVFFAACRDLNELRHLALINFSTYCEPLTTGEVKTNDVRTLWLKIVPHLRKALKTVYLREISSGQWEKMETMSGADETVVEKARAQVELPYYSKYLLLAAYFASYNPANTDRRFFTKKSEGRMSKRAKASAKAAKDTDKKFLGPKQFQLDRLMAIFYSIVEGGASSSANILSQLSSLVTLNLLAKTSGDDQIDTPKYKCLVSYDFAVSVAKQVDMDMAEYLYDQT